MKRICKIKHCGQKANYKVCWVLTNKAINIYCTYHIKYVKILDKKQVKILKIVLN